MSVRAGGEARLLQDPFLYIAPAVVILLCGPIFRWLSWLGDEGFLLHGAVRMLNGQRLYGDFFEFLPPGGFVLVALWMKLFGASFAAARVLAIGVLALVAALLYVAARLSSGHRGLAAAVTLVWVVRAPFELSHHWLTTAASLAAAVALLIAVGRVDRYRTAHFLAGLFAGVALAITQSRGALICAATLAVIPGLCRPWSRLRSTALGIVLVPVALLSGLAVSGNLTRAFDDIVRYPAATYAATHSVAFGRSTTLADALLVVLMPVVLAGAAVIGARDHWGRERDALAWHDPMVRTAVVLALVALIGTYPRPDVAHIVFAVPLACPLVALVTRRGLAAFRGRTRLAVAGVVATIALAHVAYAVVLRQGILFGPKQTITTERGPAVRRPGSWTDNVGSLMARIHDVPPQEPFFFYPYMPMAPYLTARRHVAAFDMIMPGHTTPTQYHAACVQVLSDADWVVVDRAWTDPQRLRAIFPSVREPRPAETLAFEAALAEGFELVQRSGTFELRRRTATASPRMCDAVARGSAARDAV